MNIDESEINDVEDKLSKIIAFVDQLQAVSTENIEPMAHPLNQSQRTRDRKRHVYSAQGN